MLIGASTHNENTKLYSKITVPSLYIKDLENKYEK
jgi:hypothetical protein